MSSIKELILQSEARGVPTSAVSFAYPLIDKHATEPTKQAYYNTLIKIRDFCNLVIASYDKEKAKKIKERK